MPQGNQRFVHLPLGVRQMVVVNRVERAAQIIFAFLLQIPDPPMSRRARQTFADILKNIANIFAVVKRQCNTAKLAVRTA
jgi:hypothetical protein